MPALLRSLASIQRSERFLVICTAFIPLLFIQSMTSDRYVLPNMIIAPGYHKLITFLIETSQQTHKRVQSGSTIDCDLFVRGT